MDFDEKTISEIQAAIKAVQTNYILQNDEIGFETELWNNGRINLIIIIPPRIAQKVCKLCVGKHFTQWFVEHYPDSIIAHVSFINRATLGQQEVI
jgi:hypothetical protein